MYLDLQFEVEGKDISARGTERETRMYNSTVTGRKEVMNYAWESVASIRITVFIVQAPVWRIEFIKKKEKPKKKKNIPCKLYFNPIT